MRAKLAGRDKAPTEAGTRQLPIGTSSASTSEAQLPCLESCEVRYG
jgi:hypothetical protein